MEIQQDGEYTAGVSEGNSRSPAVGQSGEGIRHSICQHCRSTNGDSCQHADRFVADVRDETAVPMVPPCRGGETGSSSINALGGSILVTLLRLVRTMELIQQRRTEAPDDPTQHTSPHQRREERTECQLLSNYSVSVTPFDADSYRT
jgi:hypothetical protein